MHLALSSQLALDLPHRPAMERDDFMVADCNVRAVSWLDETADWQAIGLIVFGPSACGKTHLAKVWQQQTGAHYLLGAAFDRQVLRDVVGDTLDANSAVIIDDADQCEDPEALFHLYNSLFQAKGRLLLTAQKPARQWRIALPDLSSRLLSLPAVAIEEPSEDVLAMLFAKLCHDRQLQLSDDVVFYLVSRLERSFNSIGQAVDILDKVSLSAKRRITIPLAKEALSL